MFKERLKKLEESLNLLKEFYNNYKLEDVKKDKILQWALKYGIYLWFTGVGEVACGVVDEKKLGNAKNYKECIAILGDNNILDKFLAEKLISIIGIRDLLKRPFIEIDLEKLYTLIEKEEIYQGFITSLKENLK